MTITLLYDWGEYWRGQRLTVGVEIDIEDADELVATNIAERAT